jgi:hypothetical protein
MQKKSKKRGYKMKSRRMKRVNLWTGNIQPNLYKIENWNKDLKDYEISENLSVSLSTYSRAKATKKELQKILK